MATRLYEVSYVVAYITFALGIASSFARIYSRALVVKLWGWDDTASCVVLLFNILHQVVLQLFLNLGCGKPGNLDCTLHSEDLLRAAFVEDIVIYTGHFIVKMTFLLFYLRLTPDQTFRSLVYIGFVLNSAVFLSSVLMALLQCLPFEKILHPARYPGVKCLETRTIMLTPPALNIAMDFYILCIPITIVWNLQMTLRRKITILFVLGFGLVSVTVAILRLPLLLSITSVKADTSVSVGIAMIVASLEVQCAIIAVNLPSLTSWWSAVREKRSSAHSNEPFAQPPYQRSSLRVKTKSKMSMDSITRLERGLNIRGSEEQLVQQNEQ